MGTTSLLGAGATGHTEHTLDLIVEHQHEGGTNGTEGVGTSTLEEGTHTLILSNLGEAVEGTLVEPLLLGLLGLHLETTTDGVEGVRGVTGGDGDNLGNGELGGNTNDTVVLLEGVLLTEGVIETEVHTTVGDDTDDGDTETVVETKNTLGATGSLHQAVSETVEVTLASADIGSKTSTGVVERVDNAEGTSTSKTTRGHVDEEELAELLLGVNLGEQLLDAVLEGEVEGLGGEVTDDVGHVTTPERGETLLFVHTHEAVSDAGVAGNLTGADAGVSILSLDQEFHTLNGGGACLGDGARDTSEGEVNEEIDDGSLLGHLDFRVVGKSPCTLR
eukprot:Colp12_sorted_trinity150504_noHs@22377